MPVEQATHRSSRCSRPLSCSRRKSARVHDRDGLYLRGREPPEIWGVGLRVKDAADVPLENAICSIFAHNRRLCDTPARPRRDLLVPDLGDVAEDLTPAHSRAHSGGTPRHTVLSRRVASGRSQALPPLPRLETSGLSKQVGPFPRPPPGRDCEGSTSNERQREASPLLSPKDSNHGPHGLYPAKQRVLGIAGRGQHRHLAPLASRRRDGGRRPCPRCGSTSCGCEGKQ
jgi:hypothetical protein